MMRAVYAAWLSKADAFDPGKRAAFITAATAAGLQTVMPNSRTMIACNRCPGDGAVTIFGRIHQRDGTAGDAKGTVSASSPRQGDAATRLVHNHWGDYIAIGDLSNAPGTGVLRAPFGDLACYWTELGDHVLVASSIALLNRFGSGQAVVDWLEIGRWLAAVDLNTRRTCLSGIHELSGGELLRVTGTGVEVGRRWSPWDWTDRGHQFGTREAAAAALRDAAGKAIAGGVPEKDRAMLLLSGGLDSSIVAAALTAAGRSFDCITMVSPDSLGDERDYAQAMATHVGAPWHACDRDAGAIDLTQPLGPTLPRPSGAQFRQATFAAARSTEAGRDIGLILDGGGGDNMFCSLHSAAPVVDHLLTVGPSRDVLATAIAIAGLADVSVVQVLNRAARRLIERRTAYGWPTDWSFLNRAGVPAVRFDHPWLTPPSGTLPGKAAQVGLLLAATAAPGRTDDGEPPVASPLVAQPVAEAVLRVPTWMWFENGRNRAIVRRAFATELPATVVRRRSKGTPAAFMAALVEERLAALRPFLLDGLLAAHGLLNRPALENALATSGPARNLEFARILQLADAEAWARSWQ